MDSGVTRNEAARQIGVSRQAINKRIATGKIRVLPDGTLDRRDVLQEAHAHDPSKVDAGRRAAETRRHRKDASPTSPVKAVVPQQAPRRRADADLAGQPESFDRWYEAAQRWRRRLTRAYGLGYLPRMMPVDAVHWCAIDLAAQGMGSLQSHVEGLGNQLGLDQAACERMLERPLDYLLEQSAAFLLGVDKLALAEPASPRWRWAKRPTGSAATAWDAAQVRRRPRNRKAA